MTDHLPPDTPIEKGMEVEIWHKKIHYMDYSGEPHFRVQHDGHTLSFSQEWKNHGDVYKIVSCSCGAGATEAMQFRDDPASYIKLDSEHEAMLLAGLSKMRDAGWRVPIIRGLAIEEAS